MQNYEDAENVQNYGDQRVEYVANGDAFPLEADWNSSDYDSPNLDED